MQVNHIKLYSNIRFCGVEQPYKQDDKTSSSTTEETPREEYNNLKTNEERITFLIKYNADLIHAKEHPRVVSLDRNPVYVCNIPYIPGHFYRVVGENAYLDLKTTGKVKPSEQYQVAYFEEGRANDIYARKKAKSRKCIIEATDQNIREVPGSYPYAENITKNQEIRIWRETEAGSNIYTKEYDNINDVVSNNLEYIQEGIAKELESKH